MTPTEEDLLQAIKDLGSASRRKDQAALSLSSVVGEFIAHTGFEWVLGPDGDPNLGLTLGALAHEYLRLKASAQEGKPDMKVVT